MNFPELYPELFKNCFGCYVSKGWEEPVNKAIELLDLIDSHVSEGYLEIRQIKEKFAGLRIYTNMDGHPIVDAVKQLAQMACVYRCQDCGDHGKVETIRGKLMKVLCSECLDKVNV